MEIVRLMVEETVNLLEKASGFELHRINLALQKMLDDPARIDAVKRALRVGQEVECLMAETGTVFVATVLEIRRTRVLVNRRELDENWTIPFTWINLEQEKIEMGNRGGVGMKRHEVSVGMALGFADREGREHYGKVVRLNPKTVTIDCGAGSWRVAYAFIFPVQDIVEEGEAGGLLELGGSLSESE